LIQMFEEYKWVDSDYKIISDGKVYDTDQFTTSNISEGFISYERISIWFLFLKVLLEIYMS
jgi:hypothetical protein